MGGLSAPTQEMIGKIIPVFYIGHGSYRIV